MLLKWPDNFAERIVSSGEVVSDLLSAGLKSRFRGSAAGFLWVSIGPIITYGVQAIVFSSVLHMPLNEYLRFLAAGLLPWLFLVQTLEMSVGLINHRADLIRRFSVSPFALVFSQAIENLFCLALPFLLVIALSILDHGVVNYGTILWKLPAASVLLIVSTVSLATTFSLLQVFYYDTRFVLSWVLSLAFYLTPILYPISLLPDWVRPWILWNPLSIVLRPMQQTLLGDPASPVEWVWLPAVVLAIAIAFIAHHRWRAWRDDVFNRI